MLSLLLRKVKSVVILSLLLVINISLLSQESNKTTEWINDLDYLKDQIYKTLPQAEERINENDFNLQLAKLKSKAFSLSKEEMAVEIMSLLALTKDNDCFVYPFQEALNTQILPLKTYFFSDGLYVCDAAEPYADLIGEKIEQIGNYKIDNLFKRLQAVMPADNVHYQRYQFSLYSQLPNFLKWAGAIDNQKEVSIVTSSGATNTVSFGDLSSYLKLERTLASQVGLTSSQSIHEKENYWMEFLEDGKCLFVQLKAIANNKEGNSFSDFVKEIEILISSGKVEKVIIDNRYGGGGNGFMLSDLTDLLHESKAINQSGKLFVLTSRSTKGALLELSAILQLNTKAILVGEASGEGPNTVGDRIAVTLPSSEIEVNLTKVFWPTSFRFDQRKTIQPDLKVNYTHEDYLYKHDSWLEAIQEYKLASNKKPTPNFSLQNELVGKYKVEGYKLSIYREDGKLYAVVKKKMRSFFELHTELYQAMEGSLSSDIPQLSFLYEEKDEESSLTKLKWLGKAYEMKE
tara:strand:- start:1154 stop:2704 length:1551 start_codon:yes stop_codon:yes gene_type:complete